MPREDKNTAIYIAYEDHEVPDPALPERNLLRAILATALSDIKKPGDSSRRATEYFLNPDDEYVFSFLSVCNHLDIDPNQVLKVTGLVKSKSAGSSSKSVEAVPSKTEESSA